MRQTGFRGDFSFLKAILVTLVAAFVIQSLVKSLVGEETVYVLIEGKTYYDNKSMPVVLRGNFCLTEDALAQGKIWTLVTYAFLHDGIFHLLVNMLCIFFIGRALEPHLGPRKMSVLYLVSTVAGGGLWLITSHWNWEGGGPYLPNLLGASAAAMGLLAYFCAQRPNDNITLLIFFVLPCNLKPKWVLWGFLGISIYGIVGLEEDNIAHSAHLGGLLAGLLYYGLTEKGANAGSGMPRIRVKKPAWMKVGSGKKTAETPNYTVNFTDRDSIQAEVDRILDKINEQGFGALTDDEKKTLDRAKNILNK
tara:strand:- start:457 stop:1377 length:921 start_codon:yes stop_codon:yes gene_type:complete